MKRSSIVQAILLLAAIVPSSLLFSQTLKEAMAIRIPRQFQRSVLAIDPIEGKLITGTWKAPREGDIQIFGSTDTSKWEKVAADSNGWFAGRMLSDGYLYTTVNSEKKRIVIFEGMGNSYAFINGIPRMGGKYASKDTYESWEPRFDYSQIPVLLERGENEFLIRSTRGRVKLILKDPSAPVAFNPKDVTLPDGLLAEEIDTWGAIVILNATENIHKGLTVVVTGEGLEKTVTAVQTLQPLAARKIPFRIKGAAPRVEGKVVLTLQLFLKDGQKEQLLDTRTLDLVIKHPLKNHKRTFISKIDGSVQYYAVNPAQNIDPKFKPALLLTVHGASVEAVNQAGSYASKTWVHIVAATNRRPYGFDWEDWGRIDALEVLDDFKNRYPVDEERVYLTGHSMGGHGAWILGATYPDKFAAIGPSAGWISFQTYASRQKDSGSTEMEKLIARSMLPGNTLALAQNYKNHGVYILHGDKDESVPVEQARRMVKVLGEFHKDFVYHEQKDAGHWWDVSDESGTDCVDWQPMFDFFAHHALPQKNRIRKVEFVTASPGVSAQCNWLRIEAQIQQYELSLASVLLDPGVHRFTGTTQNVARLAFDVSSFAALDSLTVNLDGNVLKTTVASSVQGELWLARIEGAWSVSTKPASTSKNPQRYGAFKSVVNNRVLFVYGTKGSAEENAWAYGKARFDAECFQYQGNGAIEIIADTDFNPTEEVNRNVIIYGNANTNSAWKHLLGDCPVQVKKGSVQIGDKIFNGDNLASIFLRPRKGSDIASVGVVTGSGIAGMRLTNTRPYLYAGYALPDLVIYDTEVLKQSSEGLRVAGFFGLDWNVESGEIVYK
ncbi:MAG: prolyl oligopeptidase family serine peptidase [bacterium]